MGNTWANCSASILWGLACKNATWRKVARPLQSSCFLASLNPHVQKVEAQKLGFDLRATPAEKIAANIPVNKNLTLY